MAFAQRDLDALRDYVASFRHRNPDGSYKHLDCVASELGIATARIARMLRAMRSFSALRGIADASAKRRRVAALGTVKAREVRTWTP